MIWKSLNSPCTLWVAVPTLTRLPNTYPPSQLSQQHFVYRPVYVSLSLQHCRGIYHSYCGHTTAVILTIFDIWRMGILTTEYVTIAQLFLLAIFIWSFHWVRRPVKTSSSSDILLTGVSFIYASTRLNASNCPKVSNVPFKYSDIQRTFFG